MKVYFVSETVLLKTDLPVDSGGFRLPCGAKVVPVLAFMVSESSENLQDGLVVTSEPEMQEKLGIELLDYDNGHIEEFRPQHS